MDKIYSEPEYIDKEAVCFELMNEHEYNTSVISNIDVFVDFETLYGDKDAKVLVIMLPHNWNKPNRYVAQSRYDKKNTLQLSLKMNKKTDADIIDWLNEQPNKQMAIKNAIRKLLEGYYGKE